MPSKSVNQRITELLTVFDAQASDTVSEHIKVKHYDYIVVLVATAASTDGTLKIRGGFDSAADLTAAQSVSNIWDYIHSYNQDSPGSGVAGNTGYTLGASAYAQIKVNCDGLHNLALEITGMSAGAYTAKVKGINIYGS